MYKRAMAWILVSATVGCVGEELASTPDGAEEATAAEQSLWWTDNPDYHKNFWPNGTVPTCIRNAAVDPITNSFVFAAYRDATRQIVEDAYESIPHSTIDFTGWGTCPSPVPDGSYVIELSDNHHGVTQGGYRAQSHAKSRLGIQYTSAENWDTLVLHEVGHALGFDHEQDRPDSNTVVNPATGGPACIEGTTPQTYFGKRFTVYDPTSIMSATYCHWGDTLSALDRLGLEMVYNDGTGPQVRMQGGLGGFVPKGFSPTFYLDWRDRGAHSSVLSNDWTTSGPVTHSAGGHPYQGIATDVQGNYAVSCQTSDALGNDYEDGVGYTVNTGKFVAVLMAVL